MRFDRSELRGSMAEIDYAWACGEIQDNGEHAATLHALPVWCKVRVATKEAHTRAATEYVRDVHSVVEAKAALEDRAGFRAAVKRAIEQGQRRRLAAVSPRRNLTPGGPPAGAAFFRRGWEHKRW